MHCISTIIMVMITRIIVPYNMILLHVPKQWIKATVYRPKKKFCAKSIFQKVRNSEISITYISPVHFHQESQLNNLKDIAT